MCGIVGCVGSRPAAPTILAGLQRLAYRGYDSAGLAVLHDGSLAVRRSVGKLENLARLLQSDPAPGSIGIGHTRWATHGGVTMANAHPHIDCSGRLAVVHNGIVENHQELRECLQAQGHRFRSQTDTEVIAHLVEAALAAGYDLPGAVAQALRAIRGASAIVVLASAQPGLLVAARRGHAGGVSVGLGADGALVASDMPALFGQAERVIHLDDGEMALVSADGVRCLTFAGQPIDKCADPLPHDLAMAELGTYRHYMEKEIAEQPRSLTDAFRGRADLSTGQVRFEGLALPDQALRSVRHIHIVACGTAWHAGLVGRFLLEGLARIPVTVEYASEFRYREPLLAPDDLVLAISQSGETVDTLAAMEEARRRGVHTLAIVNVIGSQAARLADGVLYLHAGPEIGVASTKAFTSMLVVQYLLAIYLGRLRGTLDHAQGQRLLQDLATLPALAGEVLESGLAYDDLAERFAHCRDALYLGRGINYPIALEGALKLKEISYIHAEGYPAGEMKHGPIALVDGEMPVVAIVPGDGVRDKMLSNLQQLKARGGVTLVVAAPGDGDAAALADYRLPTPQPSPWLAPILNTLPLQRLAYHLALARGCDVDQPRNLAKSVTVE